MLIIPFGQTGSGTSTFQKMLEGIGFKKIVRYTSRDIREYEVEGIDYKFISTEKFKHLIEEDFFMEYLSYDMFDIHNNPQTVYYGTAKDDVTKDGLWSLELTCEGIRKTLKFLETIPHIRILMEPPNEAFLRRRLINRGANTIEEIERRFLADRIDYADAKDLAHMTFNIERLDLLPIIEHLKHLNK